VLTGVSINSPISAKFTIHRTGHQFPSAAIPESPHSDTHSPSPSNAGGIRRRAIRAPTRPRIAISPWSGGKMPAMRRRSLVLLQPLRPISPRHSPRLRSKEMFWRAQNSAGRSPSELDRRLQTADFAPHPPYRRRSLPKSLRSAVSPFPESAISGFERTPIRFRERSWMPYHMERRRLRQNFLETPRTESTTSSGKSVGVD
jgi:hypothetical protein